MHGRTVSLCTAACKTLFASAGKFGLTNRRANMEKICINCWTQNFKVIYSLNHLEELSLLLTLNLSDKYINCIILIQVSPFFTVCKHVNHFPLLVHVVRCVMLTITYWFRSVNLRSVCPNEFS